MDEFGWDRLDETTLDWLYGQQRALAAAGHGEPPASQEELRREWDAEHLGLHGFAALRAGLDARFDEREFEWRPHLHRKLAGVATEVLEQALIDAGAIQALGFATPASFGPVDPPTGTTVDGCGRASRTSTLGRCW